MPERRGGVASTGVDSDSSALVASGRPERRKTTTDACVALSGLSERDFQRSVVKTLRSLGWIVFTVPNMKLTTAGLPDLLCLHAGQDVLLAWELKSERGKPTPIQRAVLSMLDGVPGVDARIVRPSQWPALRDVLLAGRREG